MAKSIWIHKDDIKAFADGLTAAQDGKQRVPMASYRSYNQRAAFNDGWDSYWQTPTRQRAARKVRAV